MKIKKALALTATCIFAVQSIYVCAGDTTADELYENLDAKLEEMWSMEGYDVLDDEELLKKHGEFANRYAFESEEEENRQMLIYQQYTDDRLSGITGSKRPDGTYQTNVGVFSDRFASLAGKITFSESKVIVNDKDVFESVLFNDRTLVPAAVFEAAGCTVEYDENTMVTTISKNGIVCELMPYLKCLRKNKEDGYWVPLHICARYMGEAKDIYYPLRAVSEELGLSVD